MDIIFLNVLIAVSGLAMVPFVTALIERYSREEKIFSKDFWNDFRFDLKVGFWLPFVFVVLFYVFGPGFEFVLNSFIATLLIISFFVDMKAQIIPNETNFIGFLVGMILTYIKFTRSGEEGADSLLGMVTGAGIFLLIALFALLFYKKVGMGLGDVKLMGMLGLFFGFADTIQIFVFSFFIGAVVSLFLLITRIKKSDEYIPFGPFIVAASFITMFLPATTTVNYLLMTL